jgi:hypothetical protein
LPLVLGRNFSWQDENVAIINETILKKLNFDQSSLGHKITLGKTGTPLQIIGVTGKMAYQNPGSAGSGIATIGHAGE